ALNKFNIIVEDLDELTSFIGPPLLNSFTSTFDFSESDARRAVEFYREYFREIGIFENMLYPGVEDLLTKLIAHEQTLMVATSKPTVFAVKILEHFGIDHFFSFVSGSGLDGTRSNKTEIIEFIFAEKGIERFSTVMIGDRMHDVIGARNTGIDSIAVG